MLFSPYKFSIDNINGLDDALSDKMTKGVDYVTAGKKANTTLGTKATAEGMDNTASGQYSHVEGQLCTASNINTHAEGDSTTASHTASHSEGGFTKTGNNYQHVQGKFNVGKASTAFEIGNGTSDSARSNAFEVEWDGDVTAAGDITDGDGNTLSDAQQKTMSSAVTIDGTQQTLVEGAIGALADVVNSFPAVFTPAGDKTAAELISALLIADNLGKVYNITTTGTTTSDFVEGAGKPIEIGDNVAIVDVGTALSPSYKFDLMSGFVDLSGYVEKSATSGLIKNDGTIDETDYAPASSVPSGYTSNPEMDGTASAGSSSAYAKGDHVHPTDSTRQPKTMSESVIIDGVEVEDVEDAIAALANVSAPVKTVEGNPIIIEDAYPSNAEELSVDIEPIQDLHGYAYPWVGGAGKNKLNIPSSVTTITKNGIKYTVTRNEGGAVTEIDADGTATADADVDFSASGIPIGSVILTGCPSGGGNDTWYIMRWNSSWADITRDNGSGVTYNNTSDLNWFRIRVRSGVTVSHKKFYPMVRLSTESDSTFAPYSNECPISGRTETGVVTNGRNIWDEQWVVGDIKDSDGALEDDTHRFRSKNYIKVFPQTTYYFKNSGDITRLYYYDKDKNLISYVVNPLNVTFTTPQNCCYIMFKSAYDVTSYSNNICINISDASFNGTYVPYQTASSEMNFGQTVYGCHADYKTGKVTITKANITLDGSNDENWGITPSANVAYIELSPDAKYTQTPISNLFKGRTNTAYQNLNFGEFAFPTTRSYKNYINIKSNVITSESDLASWRTWLSNNNLQVCYELETPIELQLTPAELQLLQGYNYITADGNITLAYKSDVASGIWSEIDKKANTADLGTAAYLDVPTSGDASSSQVVKGDDTRLTNARNPLSHTHSTSDITDFPTLGNAAARNITVSTTDLTPGTSALTTGDLYLVYEA